MKAVASLLLLLASASGAAGQMDARELVAPHNAYRARHCVPPLSWSPEIAAAAQRWVNRCVFSHDPNNQLGENLAWGSPRLTAQEAVGLWYGEIGSYNFAASGYSPAAGHFTQLIWRETTQLGCAWARCGDNDFWVCRYAPPGNVEGQLRKNATPPCR